MPGYLLMVSVGPVQEFIAAARRTRDLWFGSHLLSEVSRAAARAVLGDGKNRQLIFPSDVDAEKVSNIANVILAEVTDGNPAKIAAEARKAAQTAWMNFAADALKFDNAERVINRAMWDEQVEDVIEVYAAWVPFDAGNYVTQRTRVARLLAGRKNCRDFEAAKPHPGVPKSSLDGLRETVLRRPARQDQEAEFRKNWGSVTRGRLRVRAGEQLDAVGVVKRVWQPKDRKATYPSVSRIAADPWVRGVPKWPGGGAALAALVTASRTITELNRIDTGRFPRFAAFPFEGTAVFRDRHPELWEEADISGEKQQALGTALKEVTGMAGEPNPYLAVLVADGDRMGKTISDLKSPDEHRGFSGKLATFAAAAEAVVAGFNGVLVYSGGDDVLAFLPVDTVLPCARKLHDTFGGIMTEALKDKSVEKIPTLSVGVAIGHFMEDLEDLLAYGRAAEKNAKSIGPTKDALAVHLHKRGGSPVKVRAKWVADPDARLTDFATWLNAGALPNKVATDFHSVARVYDRWTGPALAIRGDVLRVLGAKKPRGDASQLDAVRKMIHDRVHDADSLRALADEILVARQIAVGLRQADPKGVGA